MTCRIATMQSKSRKTQGFSLVELMVALVAGLVVSLAAVAFFMSSMKSNTTYVASTRLTQELRNNMDYVNRELRRAGYDEDALAYISLPINSTARSPFSSVKVVNSGASDSCILYAYDRAGGTPGLVDFANGERHGLRRFVRAVNGVQVGVLEVADSSADATTLACDGAAPNYSNYPPTCDTSSGWCALSDPRQLNVTSFMITNVTPQFTDPSGSGFGTLVRDLGITISGSLVKDTSVVQTINSSVRVRSECLHSTTGTTQCDAAP